MPFCWEVDPRAEAEGVVLAVDVTCHARRVGFQGRTFVSRGMWVRFVGAEPGQEQRLLDTLAAAACSMLKPSKASDDGTTVLFGLPAGGDAVEVISVSGAQHDGVTFMLWREFARRPASMLRVRIVAEDDTRPRA